MHDLSGHQLQRLNENDSEGIEVLIAEVINV